MARRHATAIMLLCTVSVPASCLPHAPTGPGSEVPPPVPGQDIYTHTAIPYGMDSEGFNGWRTVVGDFTNDGYPDVLEASGGDQAPQRLIASAGMCHPNGQCGGGASKRVRSFDRPSRGSNTAHYTTDLAIADGLKDVPECPFGGCRSIVAGTFFGGCDSASGKNANAGGAGSGVFRVTIGHAGALEPAWLLPAFRVREVDVADMDGDGWLDLIVAGLPTDEALSRWKLPGSQVLHDCVGPLPEDAFAAWRKELPSLQGRAPSPPHATATIVARARHAPRRAGSRG